jgi:hypothetical protein
MHETKGYIERIRRLNPEYQVLELAIEGEMFKKIKPGQTLLARLPDPDTDTETWHPYLREQWWPAGFTQNGLLVVEQPFSHRYQPGQLVELLGPVGQPYRFRPSLRNVLLLAYDTSPTPLTIMTRQLLHNDIHVTLVLLGRAREYRTAHLPAEIEVVRGDNTLEWPDRLMTLGWADQIFVTVNPDGEHMNFDEVLRMIQQERIEVPKHYLFGVFQPLLPCGIGACHACMVRQGSKLIPVCRKGPALDLTQVKL